MAAEKAGCKPGVPLDQLSTIVAVVEMSQATWLVSALVPGFDRRPLKKLTPDPQALRGLLDRWRGEAERAGHVVTRIALAYEAGRDGFWLARWLEAHGIEAHVIHPTSVAVSREHRRAKTDRLDAQLLLRAFSGWLRGELGHCSMAIVPTLEEEDARRPSRERENLVAQRTAVVNRMKGTLARLGIRHFNPLLRSAPNRLAELRTAEGVAVPPNTAAELLRDMARLRFIEAQIREIEAAREVRLGKAADRGASPAVRLLSRIVGVGTETADMLVHEVLHRNLRDRRALARYAGLTGAPDESGAKRREKGLARAGNSRVRHGMVQLAWRFLVFQKTSALVRWYKERTQHTERSRKSMIVALARKLLIALWRFVRTGQQPDGIIMRPAP